MKKIMQRIDRYCILHPGFGIKNLMIYIVIGNIAVLLLSIMDRGLLSSYLIFSAREIFTEGQIWRLLTFVLVPNTSGIWLVIQLYFYYSIGSTLERYWGKGKFTVYYLMGVFLTVIYGSVIWFIDGSSLSLTALYINLSLFLAFATVFPDAMVLLFFIIPIKMKWLGIISGAFFVATIISMLINEGTLTSFLPVIALLNYLLFCGDRLFDLFRPAGYKQRNKTINYKRAARNYNKKQTKKPYTRKCEVCGKTDTEYPDLEFRFCSRCVGYHCFCIDHINSHIHFTE